LSSRSSNSERARRLTLGTVHGHRGGRGELTVKLAGGRAAEWTGLDRVWIEPPAAAGRLYEIEHSRGYRDRLVLKLRGVDDPNEAARLRGNVVQVFEDELPALPEGVFRAASLVGLAVVDEERTRLGQVLEVVPTAGTDLLRVAREGRRSAELLIPMAREIVREISLERGYIRVRLPAGLAEL
jgi:16S rRNA processing protein RimM